MDSLWRGTAELPRFDTLKGELRTDVLVIGGGMAGLLCAHQLKNAGVNCVVAEADRVCGGVTGGTTAKITAQHGLIYSKLTERFGLERARLYLRANLEALEEYRRLCREIDCDFEEQDSYVYSLDDTAALEQEFLVLDKLSYPAKFVRELPLPFQTAGAVVFPGQAQFHPLKFFAAICRDLSIFENTRVRAIEGNTAVTDGGKITAEKIIVATHFPFLNTHGLYFLKMYQQRSYVLALENAAPPAGMYVDAGENGLSLRQWGGLLLLGGGGHRTGKPGGGYRALEEVAVRYFPAAREVRRWAAQDCMTLDGVPYIGRYGKQTENLYVATGFNKWGVTSSMAAARVLTDLVQGWESPYSALFDPARSILHPQLGTNAWESAVNLATPTAKRCPHLGCALKWNEQEQSWDCPCHGSRFTADGRLLDGPATGGLPE